jgi:hypothetical protein
VRDRGIMGMGGEQVAASRREDFLYSDQVRVCPTAIQTHAHGGLVAGAGRGAEPSALR